MRTFSKRWKASKQPRKQRKYAARAPLHLRKNFLSASLSKELRKKYKARNVPLRKGDRVRVMRGEFRKRSGKIVDVDVRGSLVFIEGVERVKRNGSKRLVPLHPSKVQVVDVDVEDKMRKQALERLVRK